MEKKMSVENRDLNMRIFELLLYQLINMPYLINVNTPYESVECQYIVLRLQNTPYCLEEQIRCLDCRDQYLVLSRRVDTSYPTGGYGVSVDLS
ncbi:hypothetical protein Tco_0803122 [Tanacetum coccineum]|uniref:Uncharacterized protein n=1 Tax=Tanacetum coccineum TaxID=301880 RepID=A0ABQ5A0P1_9ASTR